MKNKFIRVRCGKCANEQIIFGKSSSSVKCLVCGAPVAEPAGGKARIKAKIVEILS